MKIIGIEATNIRGGGGVTHLIEFCKAVKKIDNLNYRFVIWSNHKVLDKIENNDLFIKKHFKIFEKNFLFHILWRIFILPHEIKLNKCDILFVPGGSYSGSFNPVVTMCRNMLPFEVSERNYYFFSMQYLKLLTLKYVQLATFKRSDGVIFLTKYARDFVINLSNKNLKSHKIIAHGISKDFKFNEKINKSFNSFSKENPISLIYVSSIDHYKHQDQVVLAIKKLIENGYPVKLDLIGASYEPALKKLNKIIDVVDAKRTFITYHNYVERNDLIEFYRNADIAIFASSCENLPNILLEYMAAKIPIVCTDKSPMKEILKNNGSYCNPCDFNSIFSACAELINNLDKRNNYSKLSHSLIEEYSWENNSRQTIKYFSKLLMDTK